jgi:signal transduction histidine kinase
MRFKFGLRLRVALSFAAFSFLVVTAQSVALYMVSEEQGEDSIDRIVSDQMDFLIKHHDITGPDLLQTGPNILVYVTHNDEDRLKLPKEIRSLEVGTHEVFIKDVEYHAAVRNENNLRYYLLYDVSLHEQELSEFGQLLIITVVTIALFFSVLSYWLAGLLVNQVSSLAQRVNQLGPGRETTKLAAEYQDEEVVKLARAFDDYQQRVDQLIGREKEFTGNISHELRTPLTSIKTSCDLLLQDATLSDKSRSRVNFIAQASDRMSLLINALLFLAREEYVDAVEDVNLRECLDEILETFCDTLTQCGLEIEIDVDPSIVLKLNRQSLGIVITNLIKNAIAYTERGRISISYHNNRLTISDTGKGIRQEELPRVFERFYRGESIEQYGTGLGLFIVKRLCDRYDWEISVTSKENNGTTFTIIFPSN